MEFKATHRYARMGVRKARLVMDIVRGRTASQALDTLANDNHRASLYIRKVLASAVANALQNPDVRASRLVVSEAVANDGPLLQGRMRFRPSAMGRALPFRRRTCHLHIKVTDPAIAAPDLDAAPADDEAAEDEIVEASADATNETEAAESVESAEKDQE